MNYSPPEWSSVPLNSYSVQLIDEGVVVLDCLIDLKPFYSIGRDSDIKVLHDSVQSFHAILQHSDEGFLFVYPFQDCRVKLNKKSLKFGAFAQVYPNDILEFASWPGILVISGPAFVKRTEKFFNSQGKVAKNIRESLQRVSWGFADDAVNQQINPDDWLLYEDHLDYQAIRRREDLSEKQQKMIQNLEKLQEKIASLQRELEKPRKNKENLEKLEKIQEKLENLKSEKEAGDENLRCSFFPELKSFKAKPKGLYDYSSSEDEFYNRVSESCVQSGLEDKQGELDKLVAERNELAGQITRLSLLDHSEGDDPLESFMQSNNWQLREQSLLDLGERLKLVNSRIQKICTDHPGVTVYAAPPDFAEVRLGMKKRKVREKEEHLDGIMENEEGFKNSTRVDTEVEWTPPEGQTGDGKTSLNEKYGY